ncbi:Phosphate regulon transcriptional regulatory protein PhoB [compost metagenome]
MRLPDSVLLFIADDAAAVALMRHLLQSLGRIQLHVAATRDEGATLARDLRPDVVILDVDLAGGDGLAVKAALDADPLTRGLPVLALSAAVDPEEARRGQAAGFVDYLTKPVRIAALAESLLRLLAPPPGGPQTAAGA